MRTALLLIAILLVSCCHSLDTPPSFIHDKRPPVEKRTFSSPVIEEVITDMIERLKDKEIASLFYNCFPNTLDTTIHSFTFNSTSQNYDSFVITGDIPAMWLRDSSAQVWPYLQFINMDKNLKNLILGIVTRQVKSIVIDSYANAFQFDSSTPSPWSSDTRIPKMQNALWEGKYELDSLIYALRLSNAYLQMTNDTSLIKTVPEWLAAMHKIVDTITVQQKSTQEDVPPAYYFYRSSDKVTAKPNARTGMVKSYFRPSDDYSDYLFPIAANAMAVVELNKLSQIIRQFTVEESFAKQIDQLAASIETGINTFGIIKNNARFAYEVDGLGNQTKMDDANNPSLLSLPYFGFLKKDDPLYLATRQSILSKENPYYYEGTYAKGIGSPHTYEGWIWNIALTMQGLTSNSDEEITTLLEYLKTAGTVDYFMHESFDPNDVSKFTREWFAWANSLFGEFILQLAKEKPHLIF